MARTSIDVQGVLNSSRQINAAKSTANAVRGDLNWITGQISSAILNRNNLRQRLRNVSNNIAAVESRMNNIRIVAEGGANRYYNTDLRVKRQKPDSLIKKIRFSQGPYIPTAVLGQKDIDEVKDKDVEQGGNTFWQEVSSKDGWKRSVLHGKKVGEGEFLGVDAEGELEGSVLGVEVKRKSKASWSKDLDEDESKGDFGFEEGIDASAYIAKGSAKGNYGILGGEIGGSVGNVGASGSIGATLWSEGKFSPAAKLEGEVKASVLEGEAEVKIGTDSVNGHIKGEGTVLGAEANAEVGVGVFTERDEKTGETKTEVGVKAEVGAEAYLAEGTISGGITIFGIDIDVGVSGKAGGVGVSAGGKVTTGGVSGKIGAGLGLGAGLEVSIDWSDFSLW